MKHKKKPGFFFFFLPCFVSEKIPHNVAMGSKKNVDLNFVIC